MDLLVVLEVLVGVGVLEMVLHFLIQEDLHNHLQTLVQEFLHCKAILVVKDIQDLLHILVVEEVVEQVLLVVENFPHLLKLAMGVME